MRRLIGFLAVMASLAGPQALAAERIVFAFSPKSLDLQIHWKDGTDQFWTLQAVRTHLEQQGRCPVFLSNAGIYGKNYAPLGLFIQDGRQISQRSAAKGSGNFSWNSGIFTLRGQNARIMRHTAWRATKGIDLAIQSGPTLVVGGKRTSAGRSGADRFSRGAIVTYRDGRVGFAHTLKRVSFSDLVDLAATQGRVQGMLYLDGRINDWWARGDARSARRFPWFAAIFSVSRKGGCPDPLTAPLPLDKPEAEPESQS